MQTAEKLVMAACSVTSVIAVLRRLKSINCVYSNVREYSHIALFILVHCVGCALAFRDYLDPLPHLLCLLNSIQLLFLHRFFLLLHFFALPGSPPLLSLPLPLPETPFTSSSSAFICSSAA